VTSAQAKTTRMKSLALCALLASMACASSPPSPSIYGNWEVDLETARRGLSLKSDGSYVMSLLSLSVPPSARAQLETGTFSVADSIITFTPETLTCVVASDPSYTASYKLDGSLKLTFEPTGPSLTLQSRATPAESEFSLMTGCFLRNQSFAAGSTSPIGHCAANAAPCSTSMPCCVGLSCVAGSCAPSAGCPASSCVIDACQPISYAPQSLCAGDGGTD
jgi:hypothetical protein